MRQLIHPARTSSVHSLKLSKVLGPNVLLIATSGASRPRAMSTLPMRGVLLRARFLYRHRGITAYPELRSECRERCLPASAQLRLPVPTGVIEQTHLGASHLAVQLRSEAVRRNMDRARPQSSSTETGCVQRAVPRNGKGPMRVQWPLASCPPRHAGTSYPFCLRFSSSRFCSSLSFFLSSGLPAAGLDS
jgi:hypothetical protein